MVLAGDVSWVVICMEVVFKAMGMVRQLVVSLRREMERGSQIQPWGNPLFKIWGQGHPYVYPKSLTL